MSTVLLKKYWIGHEEMLLLETEPTDILLFKKIAYMYECLHVCMYSMCVTDACRGQKKVSDPLDVEFWIAASHLLGAGSPLCVSVCVYSLKSNDFCTP